MKTNDFPSYVTNFFSKYLTLQRGMSPNTVASYSDSFLLLFLYCSEQRRIDPEKLTFEKLTRELVLDFCQWLEDERHNCARTRNLRLTALQSFFRFVQMQSPEYSALCSAILSIPLKSFVKKLPVHLSEQEIRMLFSQPDAHTKGGTRDLALMTVLFDSGMRISELANLKMGDLHLSGSPGTLRIQAKGGKLRQIPLCKEVVAILRAYLNSEKPLQHDAYIFTGNRGERLTRPGINDILAKYVARARTANPGFFMVNVTAHVLRHTKATLLLLNGVNLIYIRDLLGHASVTTTELYARSSPELLKKALDENSQSYVGQLERYTKEKKQALTEFLHSYRV
ncbi:MAG: tyrosine-type recombinase/integrase [Sphaerochaeta sp.]